MRRRRATWVGPSVLVKVKRFKTPNCASIRLSQETFADVRTGRMGRRRSKKRGTSTYKTRVTVFSRGRGYRFLECSRLKLCLHENFLIQTSSPPCHLGFLRAYFGGCGDGSIGLGRHFRARKGNETRRLLLWLRNVKDLGGLREDVRVAEICFAVVGGNLRKAADESSGGKPRRRTAPAETRARRAGSELKLFS